MGLSGMLIKTMFWVEFAVFFFLALIILGLTMAGKAGNACFYFAPAAVLFWAIDDVLNEILWTWVYSLKPPARPLIRPRSAYNGE